jgi:hypothetical protein
MIANIAKALRDSGFPFVCLGPVVCGYVNNPALCLIDGANDGEGDGRA